jgi:hypothetical protein
MYRVTAVIARSRALVTARRARVRPETAIFGQLVSRLILSVSACPASAGRAPLLLLGSDGGHGIPELAQQRGEHPHVARLPVRHEQGEPVQADLGEPLQLAGTSRPTIGRPAGRPTWRA